MPLRAEIEGLRDLQRKREQMLEDLGGQGLKRIFFEAALLIHRDVRINAPVDTGRGRASIIPEVRTGFDDTIEGVVGTNVQYMAAQETGTGTFVGNPRHWPPPAALDTWARRHGFPNGYVVARIIGLRGGLRPKHFFKDAFEKNKDYVTGIIGQGIQMFVNK